MRFRHKYSLSIHLKQHRDGTLKKKKQKDPDVTPDAQGVTESKESISHELSQDAQSSTLNDQGAMKSKEVMPYGLAQDAQASTVDYQGPSESKDNMSYGLQPDSHGPTETKGTMSYTLQQTFCCDICQACFQDVYQYEQHKLKHSQYPGPLSYPMGNSEMKMQHPGQIPLPLVPGPPPLGATPMVTQSVPLSRTEQIPVSSQHSLNFVPDVKHNVL